jgi:hypothetical protein
MDTPDGRWIEENSSTNPGVSPSVSQGGSMSAGGWLYSKGQAAADRGSTASQVVWCVLYGAYRALTPGGDSLSELNARAWNGEQVTGAELALAASVATGEVVLVAVPELGKVQATILNKGNVFKVISKEWRWGFRIDPAHHGKAWGHMHFWNW